MTTKTKSKPRLPRHPTNPVGQTRRIRETQAGLVRELRGIERWLLDELDSIPVTVVNVSSFSYELNRWDYDVTVKDIKKLVAEIKRRFGLITSQDVARAIRDTYAEATAKAVDNLTAITAGVAGVTYAVDLFDRLKSRTWGRKVSLLETRVLEALQGFTSSSAASISSELMRSIESGLPPEKVTDILRQEFGVSRRTARRLVRTEIADAVRQARLDEDALAEEESGVRTRELHLSAFLPTTRAHHAARHGHLFTREQVREFYATGGNRYNCHCSIVSVLVDADGNPIDPDPIEQLRARAPK